MKKNQNAMGAQPITAQNAGAQPTGSIQANFEQLQQSMVQKNRTSQYLAQNSNKTRVKSNPAELRKRAEDLMSRIMMIRKP